MQALVALADDLATAAEATGGRASLADLVTELDERASAQHAPTVEGVTLASLHAAKGLEWDAVFLAGMSEGLMPISLAETESAVAEERRLLYVGITRAREHLELSFARSRNPGGRASRRRTRFLDGLWPTEEGSSGRSGGTSKGARAGRSGRDPRVPATVRELVGDVDLELYERLRSWRAEVAAQTSRPAYTVLVDSTLAAIAQLKPGSIAHLARINGIGPAKLDKFGPSVLAIVAGGAPDGASRARSSR